MSETERRDGEDAYVVFDTETTGIDARRCRVIEIGAVRIAHGLVVSSFSSLVNPGVAVPRRITQLTGISTAEVITAPAPEEVLPAFQAFCEGATLVAHNASFDHRFIDAEFSRLGMPALVRPPLCTVKLARRLLPGLRSKSLRSLIAFYGLRPSARHRALADAEMTAEIFLRLQQRALVDHGVEGSMGLRAMMTRRYAVTSAHLERIRAEVLPSLPDAPGVYRMLDERGKVLYIGKATRLSQRVRSYFTAVEAHPSRLREMLARVRHVRWEETPTELQALLLESRLIKKSRPPFNKAQLHYRRRPYLRLVEGIVTAHRFVRDDGADYYGPLPDRTAAESLVALIAVLFPGAAKSDPRFAEAAERLEPAPGSVKDFLSGGSSETVCANLDRAMRVASTEFEFEVAGLLRDWHALVTRLSDQPGPLLPRVFRREAVIVRTEGNRREVVCVSRGRIADIFIGGDDPVADESKAAAVFETARSAEQRMAATSPERNDVSWSDYWGTPALGSGVSPLAGALSPAPALSNVVHSDAVDVGFARAERSSQSGGVEVDSRFDADADEAHILAHWMYVHRAQVEEWNVTEPVSV